MTTVGAREGIANPLRRLVSAATARDLRALVVPGPEVLRARALDLDGAGLRLVATPRHANVLVIIEPLHTDLREAATVLYAQMMRPRALLALGHPAGVPVPAADITSAATQSGLLDGVKRLRALFSLHAFRSETTEFRASALGASVEYVCPMHPAVVQGEPGTCPECGMTLVPRATNPDAAPRTQAGGGKVHDHHVHSARHRAADANQREPTARDERHHAIESEPAHARAPDDAHDHAGAHDDDGDAHAGAHDPDEGEHAPADHSAVHDHHGGAHEDHGGAHAHGTMDFMSMVAVTRDLPRSRDGLPMDWIEVPFGPFFPGLPGGLRLWLTLDGDGIAEARAESLVGAAAVLAEPGMTVGRFVDGLASIDPLAQVAYRLLACRAVEAAASATPAADIQRGRLATAERERVASHLSWLSAFGRQSGPPWLERRAAALQLATLRSDVSAVTRLAPAVHAVGRRLSRTPLLRSRLAGLGRLSVGEGLRGPVARASGLRTDARSDDAGYAALGFELRHASGGDAYARLLQRLDEMEQSLQLIESAGVLADPVPVDIGTASGEGWAAVETARGEARLHLTLDQGRVAEARLDTASTLHLRLLPRLLAQQELGDALAIVGSVDISPWEVAA